MGNTSDPHTPALSVQGLSYETPSGDLLLNDVSFELGRGQILAIAGPNGAGKSTLLNLMSGLEEAPAGKVWIDGQDISSLSIAERAQRISIVAQHGTPDPRLTLLDYVTLGQMPIWAVHSVSEHHTALQEVLSITGLSALAGHKIAHLSGGELQRAHIARALVQRPSFLFLDEPTNHLDPDAKGRMLSLICDLGVTVVMVLHDIVLIPEFATHVALMKDARLISYGPVAQVQTPQAVQNTFGVTYRLLPHNDRIIPALDIRKTTGMKGHSL